MSHFGVISPPVPGHINPFLALARELQNRGDKVTFFHMPDMEASIRAGGSDFCAIGKTDHPLGSLPRSLAKLGQLSGLAALRFTVQAVRSTTEMICRDAPNAVRNARVDALLVDQTEPAGGSVAEHLEIPFVTICNALALNREPDVPPPFTSWDYHRTAWGRLRNRAGYVFFDSVLSPVRRTLAGYRTTWKLPRSPNAESLYSPLAQISQQPREFDFPRLSLPECFHHVGPLRGATPADVEFPWEWLDGRPLIYASLGTLQNNKANVFRQFVDACRGLKVQLVLAGADRESLGELPENTLAVHYAPQLQVLQKVSLTLTHGGLNTVLDSLSCGVPMVVLPITFEQPAIGALVRQTGVGEVIPLSQLDSARLRKQVVRVMGDERYTSRAAGMAASIRSAGGVRRAADLVQAACRRPS